MIDNEEESFIILGSSPTPSMEQSVLSNSMSLLSIQPASANATAIVSGKEKSIGVVSPSQSALVETDKKPLSLKNENVATKFLLGEINKENLMSSVFVQFPSLNAAQTNPEDVIKIHCLLDEHASLKENLQKTNIAMRHQFSQIQAWQDDVKKRFEEKNAKINELEEACEKLQKDKDECIKALADEREQIQVALKCWKNENEQLVMTLSEKESMIRNLSKQIENVELEKASFVVLHKNKPEEVHIEETIPKSDHQKIVKELNEELSRITAKTLEFEEIQRVYQNQITTLRENLLAAEAKLRRSVSPKVETISKAEHEKVVSAINQQLSSFADRSREFGDMKQSYEEQINQLKANLIVSETKNQQLRHSISETPPEPTILESEHRKIVKDLNYQLSVLAAKNLEFEDMHKVYTDELNCLKVNLTAAQELHGKLQQDLAASAAALAEEREKCQQQIKLAQQAQEEAAVHKAQADIYKKDWEIERLAREKLATEKDNILTDLKLLQKRNKELIEDAQQRAGNPIGLNEASGSQAENFNGETETYSVNKFICPVCSEQFRSLKFLEQHIGFCLKD